MSQVTAESRLADTFFIVEATSFEQHMLWEKHHKNMNWQQIHSGWLVTVGKLDGRPCCVDMTWAKIDDQLVMFYDQCSQVTDVLQTNAWIYKHFNGTWDNGTRTASTDAGNFHLCLNAIREKNEGKQ